MKLLVKGFEASLEPSGVFHYEATALASLSTGVFLVVIRPSAVKPHLAVNRTAHDPLAMSGGFGDIVDLNIHHLWVTSLSFLHIYHSISDATFFQHLGGRRKPSIRVALLSNFVGVDSNHFYAISDYLPRSHKRGRTESNCVRST